MDLSEEERVLKEFMLFESMKEAANTAISTCNYQKIKKIRKKEKMMKKI